MIKLDVDPYCHTCTYFEPKCTQYWDGGRYRGTLVECVDREKCKPEIEHFAEEMKKKEKE